MKMIDLFIYQCQKCTRMIFTKTRLYKCQNCGDEILIIEQTKIPKSVKDRIKEFNRLGKRIERIFKRIEKRIKKTFVKAFSEEGQNEN